MKQYVRGKLPDLPTKLFNKKWPMINLGITEALQLKRAGVVQDMKRKFLGTKPPLGANQIGHYSSSPHSHLLSTDHLHYLALQLVERRTVSTPATISFSYTLTPLEPKTMG
jgi:hypothetical protein